MSESHFARRHNRPSIDGGDGHGRVVNDAIDDCFGHFGLNRHIVGCNAGNFPGQLLFARQLRGRRMNFYMMNLHRE